MLRDHPPELRQDQTAARLSAGGTGQRGHAQLLGVPKVLQGRQEHGVQGTVT